MKVLVPEKLRDKELKSLHKNHPGITQMKAIAWSYFWWNGLGRDIEKLVKTFSVCQTLQAAPPKAPLHPWAWPDNPWRRVHVDFAGSFQGKMFFIVVDPHLKWPEVILMPTTTALQTINASSSLFSRYGLADQLVSDNEPHYISEEFAWFLKRNGIKHILSASYHPSPNGQTERFTQTFKQAMWAGEKDGLPLCQCLSVFLFSYRTTPQAITDASPAELFLQQKLWIYWNLINGNLWPLVSLCWSLLAIRSGLEFSPLIQKSWSVIIVILINGFQAPLYGN